MFQEKKSVRENISGANVLKTHFYILVATLTHNLDNRKEGTEIWCIN